MSAIQGALKFWQEFNVSEFQVSRVAVFNLCVL